MFILSAILATCAVVAPYVVMELSTGFEEGQLSTLSQRAWFMAHLVSGQVCGSLYALVNVFSLQRKQVVAIKGHRITVDNLFPAFLFLISVPAVGGFFMTARTIREAMVCTTTS
jgi:membrane-bound metal-dependent hydrolase YbcI (DUF457 family)